MKPISILILAIILAAGCTSDNIPLRAGKPGEMKHICPDGTVADDPTQCPETSFCKGAARCFNGTITSITDGDTVEVNNIPIRLALVDAPNYNETDWNEARRFAMSLCPIGSVAKVDEDDGQTEGSYGRIIAVVYCNNRNLNAEMVDNFDIAKEFCNVSEFANENWAEC